MPGTGIHGYTGSSLYGGNYNISNGIIQSGSGALSSGVASKNSPYGRNIELSYPERVAASGIAGIAGGDYGDYSDYVRDALNIAQNNTAQSQLFAREMMDFQRESNQIAMNWSAQEAQKNRDWQERLSNSAHQREVKDLIAAGLNPILSANQGAYTGSGATGQGFSSSGAMGQVDTSGSGIIGSLMSSIINSAAQAHIAQLYTDAERYNTDMQYSSSRLATEASIMNNQNTTSAQKQIAREGFENDLAKVALQGEYGLANVGLSGEYGLKNTRLSNEGYQTREIYSQSQQNKRQSKQIESDEAIAQARINADLQQAQEKLENGNYLTLGAAKGIGNLLLDLGDSIFRTNASKQFRNKFPIPLAAPSVR